MAFLSKIDAEFGGDAVDRALIVAWSVSEIAVDVFGMLFWGALALMIARIIE